MPASACCVLCYSKFMESSKQPKMTLKENTYVNYRGWKLYSLDGHGINAMKEKYEDIATCFSKFMESSKQPKMTLVDIPLAFVTIIILIFIMSGIMALTQFSFNPFAFIQSYYAWIIGFVVFGYLSENENITKGIFRALGEILKILLSPLLFILLLILLAWAILATIGAGF